MREKIKTIAQTLMVVVIILFGWGIYTVVEGAKAEKQANLLEVEVQEVVETLEAITTHTSNCTFNKSLVVCPLKIRQCVCSDCF